MTARQKAGLNQTDLARRLNIRQTLVSDVETGLRQLDVVEWLDYCEALGLKPVAVLKELG